jgi:PPOX class probable F420-dependent enzyme
VHSGIVRLEPEESRRRFAEAEVARLATVRGGEPRIVPVVFAVDGDTVYTAVDHKPKSTPRLRRLDDIRAHPAVSLLVDHYESDWTRLWWARADGMARVLDAADDAIELLVAKYSTYADVRPAGPVIAIAVQSWTGWAAS